MYNSLAIELEIKFKINSYVNKSDIIFCGTFFIIYKYLTVICYMKAFLYIFLDILSVRLYLCAM